MSPYALHTFSYNDSSAILTIQNNSLGGHIIISHLQKKLLNKRKGLWAHNISSPFNFVTTSIVRTVRMLILQELKRTFSGVTFVQIHGTRMYDKTDRQTNRHLFDALSRCKSKVVPVLQINTTPWRCVPCLIKQHAMKIYWGVEV